MRTNIIRKLSWAFLLVAVFSIQSAIFAAPQEVKDKALKKQAFTLFQDMSSIGMPLFYNGKISDQSMILFGIYYNALRHTNRLTQIKKKDGNVDFRLSAKYVTSAAKIYYGREVEHQSVTSHYFNYRNGSYYGDTIMFEQLAPEEIDSFKLFRNNNTYIAYGQYPADLGASIEESRQYNSWKKRRLDLKRVGSGSKARFIITAWSPSGK